MGSFDLHLGDALLYTRERVPDDSVDLICTDPPYESLEKHRKTGTTTRLKKSKSSSNKWFPIIKNEVLLEHAQEWLRILKPGRHIYIFCDPETSYDIVPHLKAMGWKWGNRIIWDKVNIGMGYHYRRRYEDVLFFTKKPRGKIKKRKLRNLGLPDVIECKMLKGKNENGEDYYPTEKPVGILKTLIHQSAEEGELVFDPFMGSGSTGEAALSLGCRFLGLDVSPDSMATAKPRLEALVGPAEAEGPPPPPAKPEKAPRPPWGR